MSSALRRRTTELPFSTTPVTVLGHDYVGGQRRLVQIEVGNLPGGGGGGSSANVQEFIEAVTAVQDQFTNTVTTIRADFNTATGDLRDQYEDIARGLNEDFTLTVVDVQRGFDDAVASLNAKLTANVNTNKSNFDAAIEEATEEFDDEVEKLKRLIQYLPPTWEDRPGEFPHAFTDGISPGPPEALSPTTRPSVVTQDGRVVVLTGEATAVTRRKWRVEPLRVYRMRAVVRRITSPVDPANDSVQVGLAWFDQGQNPLAAGVATTLVEEKKDFLASDGRRVFSAYFATAAGTDILAAPAGAVYAAAFVRTFGDTHQTSLEVLSITDVTDGSRYAPDVSLLEATLSSIVAEDYSARMAALEVAAANPKAVTFGSVAEAQGAQAPVPLSAEVLVLLGYGSAGDGGGGVFTYSAAPPPGSQVVTVGTRSFIRGDRVVVAEMFGGDAQAAGLFALNKTYLMPRGATVIIQVPGDVASPQAFNNAIAQWRIPFGSVVRMKAAAGTYNSITALSANHPDGGRIEYRGTVLDRVLAPVRNQSTNEYVSSAILSVTGEPGNWSVTGRLNDLTDVSVGDLLQFRGVTPGYEIQGDVSGRPAIGDFRLGFFATGSFDITTLGTNLYQTGYNADEPLDGVLGTADIVIARGEPRRIASVGPSYATMNKALAGDIATKKRNLTGTISASGTTVTGVGTAFTTEVIAGDILVVDGSGNHKVQQVVSNTSLVLQIAGSFTGKTAEVYGVGVSLQYWYHLRNCPGSIISDGLENDDAGVSCTVVTGTGTQFTTQTNPGDIIWIESFGARYVRKVVSNTKLLVNGSTQFSATARNYAIQTTGELHEGCWPVTAVDPVAKTVTWTNTCGRKPSLFAAGTPLASPYGQPQTQPPVNNINGGTVTVLKSIMRTNAVSINGVDLGPGGVFNVDEMGISGVAGANVGINCGGSTDFDPATLKLFSPQSGKVILGPKVGVYGFATGIYVGTGADLVAPYTAISGCGRGISVTEGGRASLTGSMIVGNSSQGILIGSGGYARLSAARLTGNGADGLRLEVGGSSWMDFAETCANGGSGILAIGGNLLHSVGLRCLKNMGAAGQLSQNGMQGRGTGSVFVCNTNTGLSHRAGWWEAQQTLFSGNTTNGIVERGFCSLDESGFSASTSHNLRVENMGLLTISNVNVTSTAATGQVLRAIDEARVFSSRMALANNGTLDFYRDEGSTVRIRSYITASGVELKVSEAFWEKLFGSATAINFGSVGFGESDPLTMSVPGVRPNYDCTLTWSGPKIKNLDFKAWCVTNDVVHYCAINTDPANLANQTAVPPTPATNKPSGGNRNFQVVARPNVSA